MNILTLTQSPLDWEGILNRWGLPVVILVLVAYAVYRLTQWAGPRADKMIDSHMHLVETLEHKLTATQENTQRAVEKLSEIEEKVDEIDRKIPSGR
jgi:hypothetical protein